MEKEIKILHSKIYGEDNSGTPLLVFHGLFGMLDNWGTFGRDMSSTYPVHLIDLRNHGKSFHDSSMSHNDLSEDIFNYMEHYKLEKANFLGHSLGGKAVMQFAIQHSDKVNKLIVVDIAPKSYPPHHQGIIKALKSLDFDKIKSRGEAEEALGQYIPQKSVIYFLSKSLYWTKEKNLQWRFNLSALEENYSQFVGNAIQFGTFTGETLFISGKKSDYILPQDTHLIKQQFPNYQLVTIDNAGHWVHAENPDDFTKAVKSFLD